MPLYPYKCAACGHEFEEIQKFSDVPIKTCPKCGESAVEKQMSTGSFVLKGGGWYRDGYARKKETAATKTKKKLIKENT